MYKRNTLLRAAVKGFYAFWAMEDKNAVMTSTTAQVPEVVAAAPWVVDDDPWDGLSTDAPEIGIVLRTDFTNDIAFNEFVAKVRETEKEMSSEDDSMDQDTKTTDSHASGSAATDTVMDTGDDSESDESEDGGAEAPSIFTIINPKISASDRAAVTCDRTAVTNISNLGALRLLNDVQVRATPPRPEGSKPVQSANKLVDYGGWQEVYTGKMVWIYDEKSNTDQCVRVITQCPESYGLSTGDSWRARVSHICELQVNLSSGAMKIDFGGMDRYSYPERLRNHQTAALPVV